MKKIHYTDNYLLSPHHRECAHHRAGGTGSQVATNLARMDMALRALGHPGLHVTVFDPDTVSEANIGRQLFSESEIGLNKAVALVTRINVSSAAHGWRRTAVIRYAKPERKAKAIRQTSSSPARTTSIHVLTCGAS